MLQVATGRRESSKGIGGGLLLCVVFRSLKGEQDSSPRPKSYRTETCRRGICGLGVRAPHRKCARIPRRSRPRGHRCYSRVARSGVPYFRKFHGRRETEPCRRVRQKVCELTSHRVDAGGPCQSLWRVRLRGGIARSDTLVVRCHQLWNSASPSCAGCVVHQCGTGVYK